MLETGGLVWLSGDLGMRHREFVVRTSTGRTVDHDNWIHEPVIAYDEHPDL
jgi:hypothetical protein